MKLPEIKRLVDNYSITQLEAAETEILSGTDVSIEVNGYDSGERLTHVLAALWINNHMVVNDCDFRTSQREYVKNVRDIMI
jgi:hypothetical protein